MCLDSVPLKKRIGFCELRSNTLLSTGLTLASINLCALNSSRPFNNVTSASWDLLKMSLMTLDFSESNSWRGTWNNDGPIVRYKMRKYIQTPYFVKSANMKIIKIYHFPHILNRILSLSFYLLVINFQFNQLFQKSWIRFYVSPFLYSQQSLLETQSSVNWGECSSLCWSYILPILETLEITT